MAYLMRINLSAPLCVSVQPVAAIIPVAYYGAMSAGSRGRVDPGYVHTNPETMGADDSVRDWLGRAMTVLRYHGEST